MTDEAELKALKAALKKELVSLRSKPTGLTHETLAECPTLLTVLDRPSLDMAFTRLALHLRDMGVGDYSNALWNALGLLGYRGKGIEDRRDRYASEIGASSKTVYNHENKGIAQLIAQLTARFHREELVHHWAEAQVTGSRIDVLNWGELGNDTFIRQANSQTHASIPAVIIILDSDRQALLTLTVHFTTSPYPSHVWATQGYLTEVLFQEERNELELSDKQVAGAHFVVPQGLQFFCVSWEY